VSGDINFSTPPSDGTLEICEGAICETFLPPFTSPTAYSLSGLTADGLQHDLTATFTSTTVNCDKMASHTAPVNPLPVDFLSSDYDCSQKTLTWVTASETNNDYFTITVGSKYNRNQLLVENEYIVQGNGNANKLSEYSLDLNISDKYIEIYQTDYDGTTDKLGSTLFSNCDNYNKVVTITPNPTKDIAYINGEFESIKVYNILGGYVNANIIDNKIIGLDSGVYIVVVDNSYKIKLIVE
jgi:hypothetical protein